MFKFFATQLCLVILCAGFFTWTSSANADSNLRSAYLGPSVWSEDLAAPEVNAQLKVHFAEVLNHLETKNASGLLTALVRAEATAGKRWSNDERRTVLIYLARNRQQQINRLRDYMNRGRFPLNEGQSPKAVPIFVDRHDTHCAVGHLMHLDGKDAEISQIVRENNLVRIRDVHGGNMVQWIRSSGLTQEEAAMIQPGYPLDLDASFDELTSTVPVLQGNGFTLSDFTATNATFNATLPVGFENNPNFVDPVFQLGIAELVNSGTFSRPSSFGVAFGEAGEPITAPYGGGISGPSNLDNYLYVGTDVELVGFGNGLVSVLPADQYPGLPNAEIVEIDYRIRSELGNFSQVAFTLQDFVNLSGLQEEAAVAILAQIYSGDSNQLLGEARFSAGSPIGDTGPFDFNSDTETFSLNEDFIRIKTTALVVGNGEIYSFFNEFEVTEMQLVGDVNLDGSINFGDIPTFIEILMSGQFEARADIDLDGEVTFADIPPFIEILVDL